MEKLQTPDGGEDFLLIYQEFYWSIDTPTNKIKLKGTSCEAVEIQIFDKNVYTLSKALSTYFSLLGWPPNQTQKRQTYQSTVNNIQVIHSMQSKKR